MLSDNIQKYRKEKGWSQEELAVRLNVVRQTVSKWERGISVPDAELLLQLAELLEVSVSTLLGIEEKNWRADALAEELAAVNAELARRNRRAVLVKEAANKRNLILFLCFATLFIALAVPSTRSPAPPIQAMQADDAMHSCPSTARGFSCGKCSSLRFGGCRWSSSFGW